MKNTLRLQGKEKLGRRKHPLFIMKEPPLKERAYILRFRPDGADSDEYMPVVTFTIKEYRCGLRAGDKVKLRKDEEPFNAGDIFYVLTGAEEDPECLWMLNPAGKTCSWDDAPSTLDVFKKCD